MILPVFPVHVLELLLHCVPLELLATFSVCMLTILSVVAFPSIFVDTSLRGRKNRHKSLGKPPSKARFED